MVRARFRSPNDWEVLRPLIMKLYSEEHKPLRVVSQILKEQHNFHATYGSLPQIESGRLTGHRPRMFKQRLQAWGVRKYSRPEEVKNLLRHYTREELRSTVSTGNDSPLMVDGKELSLSMVKRHLRRTGLSETSPDYGTSSSTRSRPDAISVASSSALSDAQITLADSGERSTMIEAHSLSPCHSLSSTPSVTTPPPTNLGSRESDSLGVSSLISSNVCSSIVDKSTNDYDDEESDARRKRRKLSAPNPASSSETRALACPFYKHNPRHYNPQNEHLESAMRYRTCAGPGWESISRLRYETIRLEVLLADLLDNISSAPI
jgi:Clr5 domain